VPRKERAVSFPFRKATNEWEEFVRWANEDANIVG
jgi:hypothetical protein